MARKKKTVEPEPEYTYGEYMIRWKRTRNNNWYYAPKVYDTYEQAYSYATMWSVEKYNQRAPYAIEVVTITPTTVWSVNDDPIQ